MNISTKALMFGAAMSGLMLGSTPIMHAATSPVTKASLVGQSSSTAAAAEDKHACKGQNSCKGKGGCATDGSKPPADPQN